MVDTPIGTNSPNYTLVSGDLGATIYCRVTATNASGSSNAISNVVGPVTSAVPPANAGGANLPNIADTTPEVSVAVSCTTGTWTGDPTITYAYQWKKDGANIVGATSSSYTPVVGDIGATLQCVVTATNGAGSASANSNTTGAVAAASGWSPANLGAALIAWYKADAGVYSDTGTTPAAPDAAVKQWNDQSGSSRHLVAPAADAAMAYKPTGFNSTHPCLLCVFNGFQGLTTAVNTVPQGGTAILSVFVVTRPDAGIADNDRLVQYVGNGLDEANAFSDAASAIPMIYGSGGVSCYRGGNTKAGAPLTNGTNYRLGSVFDGTDHKMYVNNAAIGSAVATTDLFTSPGAITVGSPSATWVGAIAEVVVTNSVLSGGDMLELDNYFKAKWGLT